MGRSERLTLTEEERNTRERLAKYFLELKNKDYFQILAVPRTAQALLGVLLPRHEPSRRLPGVCRISGPD